MQNERRKYHMNAVITNISHFLIAFSRGMHSGLLHKSKETTEVNRNCPFGKTESNVWSVTLILTSL